MNIMTIFENLPLIKIIISGIRCLCNYGDLDQLGEKLNPRLRLGGNQSHLSIQPLANINIKT